MASESFVGYGEALPRMTPIHSSAQSASTPASAARTSASTSSSPCPASMRQSTQSSTRVGYTFTATLLECTIVGEKAKP